MLKRFSTETIKHRPKLSIPLIETKGFYVHESRQDVLSFLGTNQDDQEPIILEERMNGILSPETMLPTGRWLFSFQNNKQFHRAKNFFNKKRLSFQRIDFRFHLLLPPPLSLHSPSSSLSFLLDTLLKNQNYLNIKQLQNLVLIQKLF